MFDGPTGDQQMSKTLKLLGVHQTSANGWIPKAEPIIDFGREYVLHFPGNSVANARLRASDDPPNIYFHPLTDTYPTHDSFIICAASALFDASPELSPENMQNVKALLASHVVVVGLQQTVSGSDGVDDKPSHSVVGQHLLDTLGAFKKLLANHHSNIQILEDLVTVFVSPTESCRKMEFMPVLTKSKERKALVQKISSFGGTAVQYSTTFEVQFIEKLMHTGSPPTLI